MESCRLFKGDNFIVRPCISWKPTIVHILQDNTHVSQSFWWSEAQLGNSGCFCWDHDDDKPHWTVRCRACLILSKCYSLDLPLWFRAHPQNICFEAYLTLSDHWSSFNLSKIPWTIWLLYCDQLQVHFSHNKCFYSFCAIIAQFELVKSISSHYTFICVAFKSHEEWSNAQRVSTPTTTMLPTTLSNFHYLNCFGHEIYALQTSRHQNIVRKSL